MAVRDDEVAARTERARAIGLFRYQLIREPADPGLSTRARGRLVREIAAGEHTDPAGRRVRVSRDTLDRWIRAWRRGGFDALVPRSAPVRAAVAGRGDRDGGGAEAGEPGAHRRRRCGGSCAPRWGGRRGSGPCNATSPTTRRSPPCSARSPPAGRAASGVRAVRGRAGPTSCGPGTPCTARRSAGARPTCSRSSTTTPARSSGTGSGSPRTPCAWPRRCARRWPPAGSRTGSTSTTGRRSSTPGCCAPAPSWGSG